MAEGESLVCKPIEERWYWFRSRCGRDRDCVPSDDQTPFRLGYCNALGWCRKNPGSGRYVEVWNPQNTGMVFKMTERNSTLAKVARCNLWIGAGAPASLTFGNDPNPYTVNVPGISDILRVPGIDDAQTRRERAQRMQRSRSALPEAFQWVPQLLNKLDDAQDLLYTGLVIGVVILKALGVRSVPGLGVLITLNDLLNGFS